MRNLQRMVLAYDRARRRWSRFKWWVREPFTTKIDYHERTRVEHRAFPYKLRIQAVESLQDTLYRMQDGGVLRVPPGWHHMTRPLRFPDQGHFTVTGGTFTGLGTVFDLKP